MQQATLKSKVLDARELDKKENSPLQLRYGGIGEIRRVRGKLYEDSEFKPLHTSKIEDVTIKGKWDMELNDDSDNAFILRLVHRTSGDSVVLTFPSTIDRRQFAESIVSLGDVKQVTPGMDLEGLVQRPESLAKGHSITRTALKLTFAAGLLLVASKLLKRRKNAGNEIDEVLEPSQV